VLRYNEKVTLKKINHTEGVHLDTSAIFILLYGFLLGLEHALDLDHVLAVSTIVSENKSLVKSILTGAVWGLGHSATLFIAGILVLVFRLTIPTNIVFLFEFAVGVLLVILGISVIRSVVSNKVHMHRHSHGKDSHIHVHSHKNTESHRYLHKSFSVGLVQALVGSAMLMLLVISNIPSITQGITFILMFGTGTIIGMSAVGTLISLPFLFTKTKSNQTNKTLKVITGLLSVVFGMITIVTTAWT